MIEYAIMWLVLGFGAGLTFGLVIAHALRPCPPFTPAPKEYDPWAP